MMKAIIIVLMVLNVCRLATIPTTQRTFIKPYNGQYEFAVNAGGYTVKESHLVYLARRRVSGRNQYKLIDVDLETMTQVETPSDPDEYIEFYGYLKLYVCGTIFDDDLNLVGIISLKENLEQIVFSFENSLTYHKLDPVTHEILSSKFIDDGYASSKFLGNVKDRITVIYKTISSANNDYEIYIQMNSGEYYEYPTGASSLIKYSTRLEEALLLQNNFEIHPNMKSLMFADKEGIHSDLVRAYYDKYTGYEYRDLSNQYLSLQDTDLSEII